jgi:hypothetical protein
MVEVEAEAKAKVEVEVEVEVEAEVESAPQITQILCKQSGRAEQTRIIL